MKLRATRKAAVSPRIVAFLLLIDARVVGGIAGIPFRASGQLGQRTRKIAHDTFLLLLLLLRPNGENHSSK